MVNKHLTFPDNVLFMLKHSFKVFPVPVSYCPSVLLVLLALLPSGILWQPSISKPLTSIPESLQIPITVSLRFWSETSLKIPDISTLLRLLYCCFLRFMILFWRFWLTFLTISNSLFNLSLAVTRWSTFSESLETWLNKP